MEDTPKVQRVKLRGELVDITILAFGQLSASQQTEINEALEAEALTPQSPDYLAELCCRIAAHDAEYGAYIWRTMYFHKLTERLSAFQDEMQARLGDKISPALAEQLNALSNIFLTACQQGHWPEVVQAYEGYKKAAEDILPKPVP